MKRYENGNQANVYAVDDANYLGCWLDSVDSTLSSSADVSTVQGGHATIEACRDAAKNANALYFGIENGNQCKYINDIRLSKGNFGNSGFDSIGQTDSCILPCNDDDTDLVTCGGYFYFLDCSFKVY